MSDHSQGFSLHRPPPVHSDENTCLWYLPVSRVGFLMPLLGAGDIVDATGTTKGMNNTKMRRMK